MKPTAKVAPRISSPGSITMPSGPGRQPNVGAHGSGGKLAKVKGAPTGPALGHLPIRKPTAGIANQRVGQANPDTAAAATKKPNRKGGAAFYGET